MDKLSIENDSTDAFMHEWLIITSCKLNWLFNENKQMLAVVTRKRAAKERMNGFCIAQMHWEEMNEITPLKFLTLAALNWNLAFTSVYNTLSLGMDRISNWSNILQRQDLNLISGQIPDIRPGRMINTISGQRPEIRNEYPVHSYSYHSTIKSLSLNISIGKKKN